MMQVIGAGVSGLTTAIVLAEAGLTVAVRSAVAPARSTSAAAGASWGPYLVNHPLASDWSQITLSHLRSFAGDPKTGVTVVGGLEASRKPLEAPQWAQDLDSFRYCDPAELPDGYEVGWWYHMPVVNMPVYLGYLANRLAAAGVEIERGWVASLDAACGSDRVVVNCTGLGARALCHDDSVTATKGQLVVVDNPGIETFFQDHAEGEDLTYFLPQGDQVVLGGSARPGVIDWEAKEEIAVEIRARCAEIEPRLANARFREHRVGIRPSRPEVRVELEHRPRGPVIHNYGHGGSGVTLSWGCAQTVLELAVAQGV